MSRIIGIFDYFNTSHGSLNTSFADLRLSGSKHSIPLSRLMKLSLSSTCIFANRCSNPVNLSNSPFKT